MKNKIIPLIGVLLLLLVMLIGGYAILKKKKNTTHQPLSDQEKIEQITTNYNTEIKKKAAAYNKINVQTSEPEKIAQLRDEILELSVPAEHKNTHLNIIIGLDLLYQARTINDTQKTKDADNKIQQAIKALKIN
mgnify:CR=1 FL=1